MSVSFDDLRALRIEWEGTEGGLVPVFVEGDPEAIIELGDKAVRDLIDAVSDEDLFVTAHVLLTRISPTEYQSFPTWNGLEVKICSDGAVTIDPEQRHDLAERWGIWHQMKPQPKRLPNIADRG